MMTNEISLPRSTPEAQGIPSAALIRLLDELVKPDSLHSLMILRHGRVCLEGWWHPYTPETPHALFSLSKSFTSIAVGLAQAEGLLSIHDTLLTHFPEYGRFVTDERMRRVTLRDLLRMASGHDRCAREWALADPDGDWVRGFLASPLAYEPGSVFVYNSAATYMLAAVIRRRTGSNVREYLIPRLFAPLGIEPGIWETCPRGTDVGGWGLYLKTEDIAKFAQLLLQNGVWNGQRLIPADYLAEATSFQIDNSANEMPDWKCGYGYQFWRSQHGFRADGASGQYALVLPEHDLAVATTAGVAVMQRILTPIWEILLPALADGPLPEAPAEEREKLAGRLASLSLPLADAPRFEHAPAAWNFAPNEAGIRRAELSFGERECRMRFLSRHGEETLTAGFGFFAKSDLQLNDSMKRRVAAEAVWLEPERLVLNICCLEASFRDEFIIDFASKEHPLTGRGRFNTFRPLFLPEGLTALPE